MSGEPPLCVALDGGLSPISSTDEAALAGLHSAAARVSSRVAWIFGSRPRAAPQAAERNLDGYRLPLRPPILEWLRNERAAGRRLVLVCTGERPDVQAWIQTLELFDEVLVPEDARHVGAVSTAQMLVNRFGPGGYDYLGAENTDPAIWMSSRQAIVVGTPRAIARAERRTRFVHKFHVQPIRIADWLKAIRLHQWVKNALIFLPAVLAHRLLEPGVLEDGVRCFLSFSLCASSVYLTNDLLDLSSDRRHQRKRQRAFAAGVLSVKAGVTVAILLLLGSITLAATLNQYFVAVLLGYYLSCGAYSIWLRRIALVDLMALALLYTLRIIAGSAATHIAPSFWLLAFSVFLFLSLGTVKRYAELLDARQELDAGNLGRGYGVADLPFLMTLGISSGNCAVLVTAFYINSSASQALYRHPEPLWLVCPLLLFWIGRVWLLTSRGAMHDDPVIFAVGDRVSLLLLLLTALIVYLAV